MKQIQKLKAVFYSMKSNSFQRKWTVLRGCIQGHAFFLLFFCAEWLLNLVLSVYSHLYSLCRFLTIFLLVYIRWFPQWYWNVINESLTRSFVATPMLISWVLSQFHMEELLLLQRCTIDSENSSWWCILSLTTWLSTVSCLMSSYGRCPVLLFMQVNLSIAIRDTCKKKKNQTLFFFKTPFLFFFKLIYCFLNSYSLNGAVRQKILKLLANHY